MSGCTFLQRHKKHRAFFWFSGAKQRGIVLLLAAKRLMDSDVLSLYKHSASESFLSLDIFLWLYYYLKE